MGYAGLVATATAIALAAVPRIAAAAPAELPVWMTGCWEQINGEQWVEECWMEPRGGIMLGSGRSGKGERLRDWEATQIGRDTAGGLVFWASPGGKERTAFTLEAQSAQAVSFVNLAHDYPQRIRYWREGKLLKAEISMADGKMPIGFTYRPAR